MAIKLIKACKELNIGMSTAVEFAAKRGHEIAMDPNTRIDDDLYLLLAKEFNKDMALRMEAEKQAMQRQEREIPKVLSVEHEVEPELLHPVQKPKVIGKIDLEADKKAAEEKAAAAKKAAEEAARAAEEADAAKRAAEEARAAAEAKKAAEEKAAQEKAAAKKAAEEEAAKKAKIAEEAVAPKKEEVIPQEEETVEDEPEVFSLGTPKLKKVPVVVGKIDLDSLNQSTHPKSKTKEQKQKEREERKKEAAARQGNNSGKAEGEKRKRERIKQGKVDINDVKNQKSKSKPQKKSVRVEIDDEEVQRQIKDTLNRLQSGKGKTNASKYRKDKREQVRERHEQEMQQEAAQSKVLKLTEFVTVNDLAVMMNLPVTKIIGTCMSLGMMVSINQRLDAETINIVAEEFGFQTEYVSAKVVAEIREDEGEYSDEDIVPRAPIVTVMGHVDHGKTSLLDYIRKSNVIAGEAGGITQHIGAYNVKLDDGRHITFLDTPGHEAFTAMRARGAQVTDIAIIIVAADDNVMPQTKEAIAHATAAGVPIVFAINKVDKPAADPERIKQELAQMNFLVEDWGGKYQSQDISAKKGIGVPELMEKVLLEAEMLDLKANPNRKATGTIIESSLDKGRGYVATVLVSNGTLKMGDIVIAGTSWGKVKAMFNERNQKLKSAAPAEPVLILGLNGAPQAGVTFHVVDSEREAREITGKREQLQREQGVRTAQTLTLDELGRRIKMGDFHELNLIVKADVDGSVEALSDSLIKLSTPNVQVNVIHKAVGAISESDVSLASASNAIIIGFDVRPSGAAKRLAEQNDVDIRIYSIIYDAIDEVKSAMEGLLAPKVKEEVTATVEVMEVFHISKVGMVAGCRVRDGKVSRNDKARVIRDGIVIHTGDIQALKRFKDDVKEVQAGMECGMSLVSYNDIKEGDIIETFTQIEVKQTL